MDDETTQVQVKSASKTKMAIAVGFLGLAALAAGFAGLRGSVLRPDLIHFMSTTAADGGLNKFSVTLKNVGGSDVRSPFILNIKLGDGVNVVRKIKVLSDQTKEGYENLESDNGSFDILVTNYRLGRNQKTTITYWFVIPSDYNSDFLPLTYTLDTTNVVPESNELNNMYKGKFNIAQAGFIKDTAYFYGYGYNPVTGEPNQPSYGYGYNPVTGEINCQSSNDCGVGGGVGYCVNGQQTSTFSTGKCLSTGVCEVITTTNTCTDSNVSSTASLPDLDFGTIGFDDVTRMVKFKIRNFSSVASPEVAQGQEGVFIVWLKADGSPSNSNIVTLKAMEPSTETEYTLAYPSVSSYQAIKSVRVTIDKRNLVNETKEDNNILEASVTSVDCTTLKSSPVSAQYFDICKQGAANFDSVCFNKFSSVYQGCSNQGVGCTTTNMNSINNILCLL